MQIKNIPSFLSKVVFFSRSLVLGSACSLIDTYSLCSILWCFLVTVLPGATKLADTVYMATPGRQTHFLPCLLTAFRSELLKIIFFSCYWITRSWCLLSVAKPWISYLIFTKEFILSPISLCLKKKINPAYLIEGFTWVKYKGKKVQAAVLCAKT